MSSSQAMDDNLMFPFIQCRVISPFSYPSSEESITSSSGFPLLITIRFYFRFSFVEMVSADWVEFLIPETGDAASIVSRFISFFITLEDAAYFDIRKTYTLFCLMRSIRRVLVTTLCGWLSVLSVKGMFWG